MDIKSRVGKIYNEILNQKSVDTPAEKNTIGRDSPSPKSLHTFSTITEKTNKDFKEKKLVFLSNTGKLKFGSTLYNNFQNKNNKK
jgi:hypothetical protein